MTDKEQLIAFIEGTLTPAQKIRMQRRLERSVKLQTELFHLQRMQSELRNEMSLLGKPLKANLKALLPDILCQTHHPKLTYRLRVQEIGLQTFFAACVLVVCLTVAPLLVSLHQEARAANESIENVPRATHTVQAQQKETEEPSVVVWQIASQSRQNSNSAFRSAIPVPPPHVTLEPSVEPSRR